MKQGLWTLLLVSSVSSAQGIDLAALLTPEWQRRLIALTD